MVDHPDLSDNFTAADPCGPNLEYDPDYGLLRTRLEPGSEAQYGSFVARGDGPDWTQAERGCRALLLRTTDITLLIWLTRCRCRLAGAVGLSEGLDGLLHALLSDPVHIHPQRFIDGVDDPQVRANALAALADPCGLVADVRDITVGARAGERLAVRDVERLIGSAAHAPGPLLPPAVLQQLGEWHAAGSAELQALADAANAFRRISNWAATNLGDAAPDLCAFGRLMQCFEAFTGPHARAANTVGLESDPVAPGADAQPGGARGASDGSGVRGPVLDTPNAPNAPDTPDIPEAPLATTARNLRMDARQQPATSSDDPGMPLVARHPRDDIRADITAHKSDHSSRRGLVRLVNQRRKLLDYLKSTQPTKYQEVVERLGLRR
ncbi:MAG: type VI secretion system protein TssA [Haliea sp.]|nr:MAG: type VI secretion system protein TssA [Haliea sp.]